MPKLKQYELLSELVAECMTHNECGESNRSSVCMQCDQKCRGPCAHAKFCSKAFPKDFSAATTYNDREIYMYPVYRRRSPQDGGATY